MMKRDAYGALGENSYGYIAHVGPIEPANPWAMYLSDQNGKFWYLGFDFDGKVAGAVIPELMESAVEQCNTLSRMLTTLGIKHVVCKSSGTGGRHIWVALREGADLTLMVTLALVGKANFSQLDHGMLHNATTGALRPPLSPHRDGSRSVVLQGQLADLLEPSTSIDDVEALIETLEARKPALLPQNSPPSGHVDLSHRGHRELSKPGALHMATINGGSDPSWTAYMCLISAANAGWTLSDAEHAALTAPGMEHFRTKRNSRRGVPGGRVRRTANDTRARIAAGWKHAVEYAATERALPAERGPKDLTELEAIVETGSDLMERFRVNAGRWGSDEATSNQQSILTGLLFVSLYSGRRNVAVAVRDLGPLVGLGRTTACKALKALTAAGYVEMVSPGLDGNAAEYRLARRFSTAPSTVRSHHIKIAAPLPVEAVATGPSPADLFNKRAILFAEIQKQIVDQRHDLFTRKGLGHLAGKLYALLRKHGPLSVERSANLLGVSTRHTATILSRLRRHKLIVEHKDGWARSKQDLRDNAAKVLGVLGTLLARVQRYKAERTMWAWWQFEVATMSATPKKRAKRAHVTARQLYGGSLPGERTFPRYPRRPDGRPDHPAALELSADGSVDPGNRWQYLGEAA